MRMPVASRTVRRRGGDRREHGQRFEPRRFGRRRERSPTRTRRCAVPSRRGRRRRSDRRRRRRRLARDRRSDATRRAEGTSRSWAGRRTGWAPESRRSERDRRRAGEMSRDDVPIRRSNSPGSTIQSPRSAIPEREGSSSSASVTVCDSPGSSHTLANALQLLRRLGDAATRRRRRSTARPRRRAAIRCCAREPRRRLAPCFGLRASTSTSPSSNVVYERPCPKREPRLDAARVVPAVADEDALRRRAPCRSRRDSSCNAGVSSMPDRHRRRQLPRRRHVAAQHVGQRVAPFLTREPALQDRGDVVGPRHRDRRRPRSPRRPCAGSPPRPRARGRPARRAASSTPGRCPRSPTGRRNRRRTRRRRRVARPRPHGRAGRRRPAARARPTDAPSAGAAGTASTTTS